MWAGSGSDTSNTITLGMAVDMTGENDICSPVRVIAETGVLGDAGVLGAAEVEGAVGGVPAGRGVGDQDALAVRDGRRCGDEAGRAAVPALSTRVRPWRISVPVAPVTATASMVLPRWV